MQADRLRHKYLEFFAHHDHAIIAGRSLVPENDPTVLFTTAGMHPLVPYILGESHPAGARLANCQQCIRTGDIEEVGDTVHLTFFEMLGNWSLGDYFKEEAIHYSYEFLTSPKWLGIAPEQLAITVFAGEGDIPRDDESAHIWRTLGIPDQRIFYLSSEHNWWGPAGQTGPCGPDTEMFISSKGYRTHDLPPGSPGSQAMEIWNDVFMQYRKAPDGQYQPLQRKCVDTGMGVERTITILQGRQSVYETELFWPIIARLEELSATRYGQQPASDRALRIIADHLKASVMIIGDAAAIVPSNVGRGYILRRIIRRAVRYGRQIGIEQSFLHLPLNELISIYQDVYPQLSERSEKIADVLHAEEEHFRLTLRKGEREFNKALAALDHHAPTHLPGEVAFRLYDTYGFPIELTKELAAEQGLTVDMQGFQRAFENHRTTSRSDSYSTFKGGLADHTAMTTRLHTATHLLHQALRDVLGNHVAQRGSNITPQRLRFDFSHSKKMSEEEINQVEEIVNRRIEENLPVKIETMPLKEAQTQGAIALFSHKYDDVVRVYSIGNYSKEVCGGPHTTCTAELGHFHILKEQSSSQGVRRIKAILELPEP